MSGGQLLPGFFLYTQCLKINCFSQKVGLRLKSDYSAIPPPLRKEAVIGMNATLSSFEDDQRSLADYIAIFRRRKTYIFLPALIVFLLALMVALLLPAKYQSLATILIEEQEVPRDFVRSTITNYADQQIQIINRRLMTVETISGIADKFGLYRDKDGNTMPSTLLVKQFAEDMSMGLVSADVVDPRSGRPAEATIAFTLSFISEDPSMSQKVTNELVTLFLNENLRTRASKASSTAQFLAEETRLLQNELISLEQKLARIQTGQRRQSAGTLPVQSVGRRAH
jgi:succinoglycan biosynthesis transport protein ExoP